jgi:hypothetical protein
MGDGMDLREWCRNNPIDEDMLWCKAAQAQLFFFATLEELCGCEAEVINTHTTKSISLPVVELTVGDVKILIRGNFYNYRMSVESPRRVDFDFAGLCTTDSVAAINAVYCEGFPQDRVYTCYDKDQTKFTLGFRIEHEVWCFIWLLKKWVNKE